MNMPRHDPGVTFTNALYLLFAGLAGAALLYTSALGVRFQDAWILAGIWPFLVALIVLYLVLAVRDRNASRFALLSAGLVFLLYALPALKYEFPYGSTPDVANHVQLARRISLGEFDTNEMYSFSPGFHLMAAVLSQLSGLSILTWVRLLAPCLAFIIPLAVYALCRIGRMPASLTRIFLVLSVLILPNLYMTNGTTFTVIFIFIILTLACLREFFRQEKFIFSILIIFSLLVLIFWHPPSSLIFPLLLLMLGLLGTLKFSSPARSFRMKALLVLGLLGIIMTFAYWMYHAGLVWSLFVANLQAMMQMDSTPALIPEKMMDLGPGEQVIILLLNHAKDGLFIALGLIGVIRYFYRKFHDRSVNVILEVFSAVFVAFLGLIVAIFLAQFGSQGYKRFLFYIVSVSVFPAGYGLFSLVDFLNRKVRLFSRQVIQGLVLSVAFLLGWFQIYPYQPLIPEAGNAVIGSSPIVWMHQVNTISQYYATGFAAEYLLPDLPDQVLLDNIGRYQTKLFWGSGVAARVGHIRYAKPAPAYLILHAPGVGGAYREQSEYRGALQIENLKHIPGMSIVYDNGVSFILYYPADISALELLQR